LGDNNADSILDIMLSASSPETVERLQKILIGLPVTDTVYTPTFFFFNLLNTWHHSESSVSKYLFFLVKAISILIAILKKTKKGI